MKLEGIIAAIFIVTVPAAAAGSAQVYVTATIVSNNSCRFTTNSAALNFGILDPSPPTPPDITVTATINFDCNGKDKQVTFIITDDDGLYDTGPDANRMKNTDASLVPDQFLPYTLSYNPVSQTLPKSDFKKPLPLIITGTVRGVDYQNAYVGNYTDTVILTINP